MDQRAKDLIAQGDRLFSKRRPLMSVCQSICDNFYPEREGFTYTRSIGEEFADHLLTSYPVLMRRELGNMISAMLRPAGKQWIHVTTEDEDRQSNADKRWLQYATGVQTRAMYDPLARMVEATKQGDHDYVSFGQCILTAELNPLANTLLHRSWHFKDVAWMDGHDGRPEVIHHQWKLPFRIVDKLFGNKIHPTTRRKFEKDPNEDMVGRRIIIPASEYTSPVGKKWRQPVVSIWIDDEGQNVLDETGVVVQPYVIPRWFRHSNSQYGYSMATMIALPEARTMQAMTLTLLDAGEMATNPPVIAKRGLFRDDFNRYPGGLTYADLEGDGALGDAMEYLNPDKSGLPFGLEMREGQERILSDIFFLNKINMPQNDGKRTAYEMQLWYEEFKRNTLPLFEPIEDYNSELCDKDFHILWQNNAFGPLEDIPRSLLGKNIRFRFEGPLNDAGQREKASKFQEMLGMITAAAQMDPSAPAVADVVTGLRDSLNAIQVPAKWIHPEEVMQKIIAEQAAIETEQTNTALDQQAAQADQMRAAADQEMAVADEA